jgi:hypothetical protein
MFDLPISGDSSATKFEFYCQLTDTHGSRSFGLVNVVVKNGRANATILWAQDIKA